MNRAVLTSVLAMMLSSTTAFAGTGGSLYGNGRLRVHVDTPDGPAVAAVGALASPAARSPGSPLSTGALAAGVFLLGAAGAARRREDVCA